MLWPPMDWHRFEGPSGFRLSRFEVHSSHVHKCSRNANQVTLQNLKDLTNEPSAIVPVAGHIGDRLRQCTPDVNVIILLALHSMSMNAERPGCTFRPTPTRPTRVRSPERPSKCPFEPQEDRTAKSKGYLILCSPGTASRIRFPTDGMASWRSLAVNVPWYCTRLPAGGGPGGVCG